MQRKRTTIPGYRGYLRRPLAPFFGGRPLDKIDRDRIETFMLAKLKDGLSPKTVQNLLNLLHGIYAISIKRQWATDNPVALVDRPRSPRSARSAHRRIRFLQPEELEALLRAVPDDYLGALERPIYAAAAMTGLRQGELLGLRWVDVDLERRARSRRGELHPRRIRLPESHRGRSVPMPDRLAQGLEHHFQRSRWRSDQDLVFAHPLTGRVLDASKLRKRFTQALERAELHVITFHELRHTFGTQMAAAGAPLRAIQAWMGHADASTTEIYAHYAPDPTAGAAFAVQNRA
jgi:integrase